MRRRLAWLAAFTIAALAGPAIVANAAEAYWHKEAAQLACRDASFESVDATLKASVGVGVSYYESTYTGWFERINNDRGRADWWWLSKVRSDGARFQVYARCDTSGVSQLTQNRVYWTVWNVYSMGLYALQPA